MDSHASLSKDTVEHCLALAWSFADDSDSSGWILPCAFRNSFVRCICMSKIIYFYDSPKDLQNCIFGLKLNPFGCGNTSGDRVRSFWVNMTLWDASKPELWLFLCYVLATRVIIFSVLSLGPQFPNIQYFDVCECLRENIMLFGSISPVRQYWKYPFFLCPTMEADMEALGAAYSIFHHSHASSFHAGFSWTPTRRYLKI